MAGRVEGGRRAMLAFGRAFARGLGVPQDYILAHMWLNLTAGRGNVEVARERDGLAAKMTPQHIALAQEHTPAHGYWAAGPTRRNPPPFRAPPHRLRQQVRCHRERSGKLKVSWPRWATIPARLMDAGAPAPLQRMRHSCAMPGLPPGNVLTPDALRAIRAAAKGRNVTASAAPPRRVRRTPGPSSGWRRIISSNTPTGRMPREFSRIGTTSDSKVSASGSERRRPRGWFSRDGPG